MRDIFLVWRLHGNGPTKIHSSMESATIEAHRLARANPRDTFVILRAATAYRVAQPEPPIEEVSLDKLDDIPF